MGVDVAWKRALCSGDLVVALSTVVVAAFLPLAVQQETRRPPMVENEAKNFFTISPLMNNPYKNSSEQLCPTSMLLLICVCVPFVVFLALSFADVGRARVAATAARLHGLLYAFAATVVVVDSVKRYCGYWRPYFYDECDFRPKTGKCRGDRDFSDAYRSFPSGHAAISMCCLLHSSLCLMGAARLGKPLRVRGADVGGPALVLLLSPVFLAIWIAASRVVDNDHWPADVTAGATIGASFASLFYHRYFPSIYHDRSHEPRPAYVDSPGSAPADVNQELVTEAAPDPI